MHAHSHITRAVEAMDQLLGNYWDSPAWYSCQVNEQEKPVSQRPSTAARWVQSTPLSASSTQHMWELLAGNHWAVLPRRVWGRRIMGWSMCAPQLLLVEDRMSTGLTNAHTACGFSVLYHLFAQKQCLLCSALCHENCLKLLHGTSIRDLFCLWNNRALLY